MNYITNHYLLSLLICKIKFANVLYIVFIRLLNTIYCSAIILYLSFASSRNGCLSHSPKVHADNLEYEHTFILNNPRGSFPWDIYKFVSDSPHCLDIFFLCNLPQLLADIPDDTEHCAAYIHRIFLPDCLVDLLFGKDSSWLTGKVRQGVKFVILCQRNFLPLI